MPPLFTCGEVLRVVATPLPFLPGDRDTEASVMQRDGLDCASRFDCRACLLLLLKRWLVLCDMGAYMCNVK